MSIVYSFGCLTAYHSVPVTITGGPAQPEVKSLPKHKKNPDVGEKKTIFSSNIFVEQEDAISFDDQEEVCVRIALCSFSL